MANTYPKFQGCKLHHRGKAWLSNSSSIVASTKEHRGIGPWYAPDIQKSMSIRLPNKSVLPVPLDKFRKDDLHFAEVAQEVLVLVE